MQVSQDVAGKFISCSSGASKEGRPFFRCSIADEEGEVMQFYCDQTVYNKICDSKFGDQLQLIFRLAQWNSGINVRVVDAVLEKKNN